MNWEQFLQIKDSSLFGFVSVNNEVLIKSETQRRPVSGGLILKLSLLH